MATSSEDQEAVPDLLRPVRFVVVYEQRGLGGVDIYTTDISPDQCIRLNWSDPDTYQRMFYLRASKIMLATRFSRLICPAWTGSGALAAYTPVGNGDLPASTYDLSLVYSVFNAIVPAAASYILLVAMAEDAGSDYYTDYAYTHPTVQKALEPFFRGWRAECNRGKRTPFARYMDASRDRENAHCACLEAMKKAGVGCDGFCNEHFLDALHESVIDARGQPLNMLLSRPEAMRLECTGFRCERVEAADIGFPQIQCDVQGGVSSLSGAVKSTYRVTLPLV